MICVNYFARKFKRQLDDLEPARSHSPNTCPLTKPCKGTGLASPSSTGFRLSVPSRRAVLGWSIQFDASELEAHFNSTTKKSQAAIDAELKKTGVFPTLKGKRHA